MQRFRVSAVYTGICSYEVHVRAVAGGGTVEITGGVETLPSGLRTAGKHSFIAVNSTSWTKLPTVPLTDRNGLALMNYTAIDIMLRYVEGIGDLTYQGTLVPAGSGIKFYDIKDTIDIYGMSASGTPTITVEEIS